MKKFIAIAFILVSAAAFIFAEKFEVTSITGNVTYEAAPGKFKTVKVGQKLNDSVVINTSVNSKIIIVSEGGESVTIKPMQKGTVADLVKANSKVANGPKKKPGSTIALKSNATSETGTQGVATASSRASEAKDDYEIDE